MIERQQIYTNMCMIEASKSKPLSPICSFSFRSKSTIFVLRRWEVLPEQVVFKEEIGRGAFGKVFKATFKESPGIEVFYKPRTQTVDWKEDRIVAVKVLRGK